MDPVIIHRVATTAVLPLVAAGGWAGYDHYYPQQYPQYDACITLSTSVGPGDSSAEVAELQRFLIDQGYLRGRATGYFGTYTRTALARFQADEGLPSTGVVDARTRDRIADLTCSGNDVPPYYPPSVNLSITDIDAPSQLSVGETGTWSVRVSGVSRSGNLRYSVVWGDEQDYTRASASAYPYAPLNSNGTFTHTYNRPGTYTPRFTVTDASGRQVAASATVRVVGNYYPQPYTSYDYDYPQPCSTYYDRGCTWGPDTYNGPGDTCYYVNGRWQGSCGNSSFQRTSTSYDLLGNYNGSDSYGYRNPYGGPNGVDYRCAYDRYCSGDLRGQGYY